MEFEENNRLFKGLKITLIILYSISLAGVVIAASLTLFGLGYLGQGIEDNNEITLEEKEKALNVQKMAMIIVMVVYAITIVFCIIALMAVIRENLCVLVSQCVFDIIGIFAYLLIGKVIAAVMSGLLSSLLFLFTYMVYKRHYKM